MRCRFEDRVVTAIAGVLLLVAGAACSGDESDGIVFLNGRGNLPPQFRGVLGEILPAASSDFTVIDLDRPADDQTVASGSTNSQGEFRTTIPETSSVAVIINDRVRVSGLFPANTGDFEKNLDGITDIACQAGVTAVVEGAIEDEDLTAERIANLEAGAAVVFASQNVDYTSADSVTAAANRVREITGDGDHAP